MFPAAADDAYDALEWAAAELADGRPVAVAGDSAGEPRGHGAAGAGPRRLALALQLLVYPVTDDLDWTSITSTTGPSSS